MKEMKTLNGYEIVDAKARGIATELEAAVEELKASGEYVVSLQDKTVTDNGSVTADSGYDGLRTVTVNVQPKLQEKTVTENGSVTADSGYDGLGTVTVNVETKADPVLQTKTVMTNGEVVPDEGYDGLGKVNVNVLSGNKDISYADVLYDSVSLSKEEYPYVAVVNHDASDALFYIYFGKNMTNDPYASSNPLVFTDYIAYEKVPGDTSDLSNISNVVASIMSDISQITPTVGSGDLSINAFRTGKTLYSNFKVTSAFYDTSTVKDLNELAYEATGVNMQEITITENGEVVPDEGCDGFSKVIVSVDEPVLQEKVVTTNGAIIPDEGCDGLSKVVVSVLSIDPSMTYADVLYSAAGVTKDEYPYIAIVTNSSGKSSVYFGKEISVPSSGKYVYFNGFKLYGGLYGDNSDLSDLTKVIGSLAKLMPQVTPSEYPSMNIDIPITSTSTTYYFNTPIESTATDTSRFHDLNAKVVAGSSVEGGYVANFYDENGTLIQSISSKDGLPIDPPDYDCVAWSKDNCGIAAVFPIMLTEDVSYYALTYGLTYADQFYAAAGLARSEYPYILYNATRNSTEQGVKHTIRFAKTHEIVSTSGTDNNVVYTGNVRYSDDLYHTEDYNMDFTNLEVMTRKAVEIISTLTPTYAEQATMGISPTGSNTIYYRYVNHDYHTLTIDNLYRLDTVIEPPEAGSEINPYALQEKTVTENGEVVPDEGYYGLSKVSVNVESGPAIDGGYTVNFFDGDKALIQSVSALYGMTIDKPISYIAKGWADSEGTAKEFPMTLESGESGYIMDLYAQVGLTCAEYLYNSYGVDSSEYPNLVAEISWGNTLCIAFGKDYTISEGMAGDKITFTETMYAEKGSMDSIISGKDLTNASVIADIFVEAKDYLSITLKTSESTYINADNTNAVGSNIAGISSKCSNFVDLYVNYEN